MSEDEWWYVLKDAKLNGSCVGFLPLETLFLTSKNVLKEEQFIFLINETFKNYKNYTNLAIAIIDSSEFFESLSKNIKELLSYTFVKMNSEDIDKSILIYERDFGNLEFDTKKTYWKKKMF